MSIKRLMAAMALSAVLTGVMAGSAMASSEAGGTWHVNGEQLTGTEAMECERGSGGFVLTGSVSGGVPVILSATGVECVNASIANEAGGAGTATGELVFTGVTVAEPSNCIVEEEKIETNPFQAQLYMDSEEPAITFDKFEPAGEKINLAVVHITGESCLIAGNRPIRGYVLGQAERPTEEEATTQALEFSSPVDETAGSALVFAGNSAHLSGQGVFNLTSGQKFGVGANTEPEPEPEPEPGAELGGAWYVGGSYLSGSEAFECATEENLTLTFSISEFPLTLEATGIECVEGSIFNGEGGLGAGEEQIVLTGVTVTGVPNCSVREEKFQTNSVELQLFMDSAEPTIAFEKFAPGEGLSNFGVLHIEGASCPIAGNRPLSGYFFGEMANQTGVSAVVQPLEFSSAVDETAESALVLAGNPAHLSGRVLTALNSFEEFGVE